MTAASFVAKPNMIIDGNEYMLLPMGTTLQRPSVPSKGMIRFNSTDNVPEFYNGTAWFQFASAIGAETWEVKSAAYTLVTGDNIHADTSGGAFTLTLPAEPSVGARCRIIDHTRSFGTNALTVERNGQNIKGETINLLLSRDGIAIDLVFADSTSGWVVESMTDGDTSLWLMSDAVFNTYADMRAAGTPVSFMTVAFTNGNAAVYDGGEGFWVWDSTSASADNDDDIILPTGHVGNGRWLKAGYSAPLRTWSLINSNTNVATNTRYGVDTSGGGVTITLPDNPDAGEILVSDRAGAFDTNNCQVDVTNGTHTIDGAAAPYVIADKNITIRFVYDEINTNWVVLKTSDSDARAKLNTSASNGFMPTHDANGHFTGEIDPSTLQTVLPEVSQVDAEAGTSTEFSSWSPVRKKQAISKLGSRLYASTIIQLASPPVVQWSDGFSDVTYSDPHESFFFTFTTPVGHVEYQVQFYLEGIGSVPGEFYDKTSTGFSFKLNTASSNYNLVVRVYNKP